MCLVRVDRVEGQHTAPSNAAQISPRKRGVGDWVGGIAWAGVPTFGILALHRRPALIGPGPFREQSSNEQGRVSVNEYDQEDIMPNVAILYCKRIKDHSCVGCAKCYKGM
jgi:hypothetical protein